VNIAEETYDDAWLSTQVTFIERQLRTEFPHVPSEHITQAVADATDRFRDAAVRHFLPMLIGRTARRTLRDREGRRRRSAA
jgi:hypothetical protein